MDRSLDTHLAERLRWVVAPEETTHGPGEFVLYWMHNAVRGHENPALDVAICLARQNGLPLLVYHGLCETYPFASDRHHAFILQGARDVQRELAERGIAYTFHLQRHQARGPYLRELSRRAAVLVTEEMPVPPLTLWIERLQSITSTPIVSVDTSCIVPAPLIQRTFTRAFEYRDATKAAYAERIGRRYREQPMDVAPFRGPLPFEPLDLQSACLATLIGQCRIDHSIAPVSDTAGGSRAGYARWEAFKEHGLRSYASRRNDAADHGGVSRMSGYLHYGMVSPFRIAREAQAAGSEKYLDELLIWRELAFHFCCHQSDHLDSLQAVPRWARESLQEHAEDPREANHSWETLARGRSEDDLWDACQRSLLQHGELHNNTRMTWGKAFFPWTDSPSRALQLCIDLNHRFALDGRDPSSYGGILWCFGQFDRPFSPSQPILGRVRQRPLAGHRKRIDLTRYRALVDRPIAARLPKVAVVGAGVAGLIAARTLSDHGIDVHLFEKSRGVGGRLATRRTETGRAFDHGAQYFTARDPRFMKYVQSWIHDGIVQPWMGRIVELEHGGRVVSEKVSTPRYVGTPSMNALAKHLAQGLNLELATEVAALQRTERETWQLRDRSENDLGCFDVVVLNCPAPQTLALMPDPCELAGSVRTVELRPCWAVMLSVEETAQDERMVDADFDGAFINAGPLSWIAKDSSKPGREQAGGTNWVLHASPDWTQSHLEIAPEEVVRLLLEAFASTTGVEIGRPNHAVAHRWLYAIPDNPLQQDCLWDPAMGLGACGDWCAGPRIEGAFLSGVAIAGTLLRHLTIDRAPGPQAAGISETLDISALI